jgi:uncharacterized protein (DUF1778 family)
MQKYSETYRLKLPRRLYELMAEAASIERRTMADFVRLAIEDRAQAVTAQAAEKAGRRRK